MERQLMLLLTPEGKSMTWNGKPITGGELLAILSENQGAQFIILTATVSIRLLCGSTAILGVSSDINTE